MDEISRDTVMRLEIECAHLGRQLEQMHDVIVAQGDSLRALERLLRDLTLRIARLETTSARSRSAQGGRDDGGAPEDADEIH